MALQGISKHESKCSTLIWIEEFTFLSVPSDLKITCNFSDMPGAKVPTGSLVLNLGVLMSMILKHWSSGFDIFRRIECV